MYEPKQIYAECKSCKRILSPSNCRVLTTGYCMQCEMLLNKQKEKRDAELNDK